MKKNNLLISLTSNISEAYALCKIVLNASGEPIDYEFVDVNEKFEEISSLKKEFCVGKKISELSEDFAKDEANRIKDYGEVALNGKSKEFTQHSKALEKWYKIKAFSPEKTFFIILLDLIDEESEKIKSIAQSSIYSQKSNRLSLELNQIESDGELIDKLAAIISEEAPNSVIIINFTDDSGEYLELKYLGGVEQSLIAKALKTVGYNPVGKKFKLIPKFKNIYKTDFLHKFDGGLYEFAGSEVSKTVANTLEKILDIREIYTLGLIIGENLLGNIHFFLRKEDKIKNSDFIESIVHHASASLYRIRSEQKLREKEERLELAMDASENAYWDWNLETNEVYFSSRYYTMLGYDPGELPMSIDTWVNLLHPDDRKNVAPRIQEKIDNAKQYAEEFRLRCKDGSYKWISGHAKSYFHSESGKPKRVVGSHVDIDEKKKNEFRMEELSTLVEQTSDSIIKTDAEFNIVYMNKAAEELTGYKLEEVLGKKPTMFSERPDDVEYHSKNLSDIEKNSYKPIEFVNKHKNGELYVTFVSISDIKDEYGNTTGYVSFQKDISEEKKLREKVEEEAENRKILLDYIQTQVWYLTDEHTYGAVNKAHADFNGMEIEEMAFKDLYDIFPHDVVEVCRVSNREVFVAGKPVYSEEVAPYKTGENRLLSIYKTPKLDESGKVEYVVCSAEDITERKKHEQTLQNFFDVNLDLLCIADTEGNFIKTNKAWEDVLGYSTETLEKSKFLDFIHSEDLQPTLDAMKLLEKQENVLKFVNRYRKQDGSYRYIEWRSHPQGKLIYAAARDITEQKIAEAELKKSEAKFRTLFETLPTGVTIADENGNILNSNESAEYILGLTPDQQKQRAIDGSEWSIIRPDGSLTPPEEYASVRALKEKKPIYGVEMGVTRGKDDIAWIIVNAAPVESLGVVISYQDITELKKAQEAIKESEEKFKKIGKSALDGVIIINEKGNVEYWNPAAEVIFGFSSEEAAGENVHKLIMPDSYKDVFEKAWKKFEKTGKGRAIGKILELTAKNSKDEEFPVEIALSLMSIKGKHWAVAYVRDITERKESERKIVESKEQFELAVNGTNDGIWDWDLRTGSLYLSKRWKEMLGYDDDELENNFDTFTKLLHPDDKSRVEAYIRKYLSGENDKYEIEFRMKHKDGSPRWILAKGEAMRDDRGKPYRMAGSHSDISERKKSEEELSEQKERLQNIIEGTNAGTWQWNVQTGETIFNEKWAELIGYTLEEISPVSIETWMKYAHPDDLKKSGELLEKHFRGEEDYYHFESRMKHKNGNWIWILDRGKAISWTSDGKPEWMFGTHMEITQRKLAEESLIVAREKAETANRAKSEFLANMSHEIRTPMNSILGFSEIMLNTTKDRKQKNYLSTILRSGKTLLSLINDILDLSKIEAGRLEISPELIDLRVVVGEMEQIFLQKTQEKNLDFLIEFDDNFPASIIIDEVRLRQILLNLTGNAVKFTTEGYVKISVKVLKDIDYIIDFEIIVEDTGIGVDEEEHERIFESFSQQSGQDSKKFGGTGLGLAISKRLCELMNGKIRVESEKGKGSKFSLVFYNVKYTDDLIEHEDEYSWDEDSVDFEGSSVLTVDDVPHNRSLVISYLENYNLKLEEAENGEIALEKVKALKPDLILMDIRMPGINGYQTTRIIKEAEETKNIPVIALTASTMQSETKLINELFDGYLRKPVQKKSLVNELMYYLPYTEIETKAPKEEESAEIEIREVSDEIKSEFRNMFFDEMEQLADLMIMDDIEVFCDKMKVFAEKKDISFLIKYADDLKSSAADFDVDNVSKEMEKIKSFFE